MSPNPLASGPVRPAAAVNEDIRTLFQRAGGRLYGADRAAYARLVVEWAAAVRAEVVKAA